VREGERERERERGREGGRERVRERERESEREREIQSVCMSETECELYYYRLYSYINTSKCMTECMRTVCVILLVRHRF
jgi:hypothetical protein